LGKESAIAEAFSAFQNHVKELKEQGVILAVCSKNNIATAIEGFNHPDSILNFNDFAAFKANWNPKNYNINEIANEINIGIDSLVFVDDNPAERSIVRSQIPEVAVPELGNDVINFIEYLDREGYFEPASLSSDDIKRADHYQKNIQRERAKAVFADYGEYLNSLEMKAEIKEFTNDYLERITQLINKTNQFNLTTNRHTNIEIDSINNNPQYLTLYSRLIDKFGDNGLISVVIGSTNNETLKIETWLMSCRVIKREVELAMFDSIVKNCQYRGLKEILGYYFKTAKNEMVADHYSLLGFELIEINENADSIWRYVIPASYEIKNKHIKVMP
jgi:FkbH-like protein